jgi:hypothetical protein
LGDLGNPKIGQLQSTIRVQYHILGLDIAMDNPIPVRVSNRTRHLFDIVQRGSKGNSLLQSIGQRFLTQTACDHKPTVDKTGVFKRQNIGVIELGYEAGFTLKSVEHARRHIELVRHL